MCKTKKGKGGEATELLEGGGSVVQQQRVRGKTREELSKEIEQELKTNFLPNFSLNFKL